MSSVMTIIITLTNLSLDHGKIVLISKHNDEIKLLNEKYDGENSFKRISRKYSHLFI